MLNKLINFVLKERLLVIISTVVLTVLGIYSFQKLPIDAFPDLTNIQVQIVGMAPGFSPLEVEKLVTYPVEVQLMGLPKLAELRSISRSSLSSITVVFEDGVDIYFARQLVLERIIEAKDKVPAGVGISLAPTTTALGEVYRYTVEFPDQRNDLASLMELRSIHDWIIKPLLKTVPGVVDVASYGGYRRQFYVEPDPEKLRKYGLNLKEVYNAVSNNNSNAAGNILSLGAEQHIVRGVGLIQSPPDINNIVVKNHEGTPIFIRDVARVEERYETRMGALVKDGKGEMVGGVTLMIRDGNAREIVQNVKAKVKEINENQILPKGVQIKPFYDRTELVQASVNTVSKGLLEGAILVILILFIMLGNFRSALIVALSLPLAIFFTFIMMRFSFINLSANLMTLGGLAIAIGMIVDGSVVMVENIYRHLSEKKPDDHRSKLQVVSDSSQEVARPILFGIGIIIIVFLPLFSLQGMEGKMFTPLATTICLALLGSILIALIVSPVLSSVLLVKGKEEDVFIIKLFKKVYLPTLHWVLQHKKKTVIVSFAILIGSLFIFQFLGSEFIPSLDEGSIVPQVYRLPSISLEQSIEMDVMIQKRIMQFPEVLTVVSNIGTADVATDVMGQELSDPYVILKPRKYWKTTKNKEELVEKMRKSLEEIPGVWYNFTQPIAMRVDELTAGVKSQIGVKLFGENLEILKTKAEQIARELSKTKGATDIRVEALAGQSYLTIQIDRNKIARFGINVADVQEIIEIAIGGKVATEVFEEEKRIEVVVRFPEHLRNSPKSIENILVNSSSGIPVPLGQLVNISWEENPAQISHENTKRRIVVECNVEDRDIGGFVKEAQSRINKNVKLSAGYYLDWGGTFENQQRAMQRLMIIVPIAIGLIFFLLFSAFDSFKQAFIVILNLPFALIGGVIALFLSGLYLSVPASIGFIALFGVAVLNGVVLVTFINQLRKQGIMTDIAIIRGCTYRLRPVLMTALVTMLGLVPLLFATGVGSEIQKPLAVVVVGGLVSSTILTLLVLPALYSWFEKDKKI
ncbi:MAG TPA: CusA/CzcA family heavy metal efflux RND transporter [candidate division Zixibacteria bacterium]|nr:CusA/CzcA family heavy metal efflux RND transporter [candidate division Zixibacteria bacterium]